MKTPTFTLYVFSSLALASPALGADAITPTDAYLERQADYLDYCASGNGENVGGIYGQVCVLAVGRSDVNTNAFSDALEEINLREDTADFELNALLRMMALYRNSDLIPASIESEIEEAILNFKYWMDEPGPDTMCWWSENHQILFHTAELMAGQLYPNNIFTNSGMTGTEHIEHARPLVLNWLQRRGQFGFSEWHSNVYLNEDIPALLNLVDFAQDQTLATQAAMVLDLVAFDFANNYFDGTYATAHGRTYQGKLIDGNHDSIREAAYLLLGLGEYRSTGNFSASHLVTSTAYAPPAILEAIALNASSNHVNKQRDGIDIKDGPRWGIGYQDYDDVVFYWGMGAYAASRVVYNTVVTVDY